MVHNLRDYLTIREAAKLIGVSPTTLRAWDRTGKLVAIRNPMNRYRLYRRPDLERFLAGIANAKRTTTGKAIGRGTRPGN